MVRLSSCWPLVAALVSIAGRAAAQEAKMPAPNPAPPPVAPPPKEHEPAPAPTPNDGAGEGGGLGQNKHPSPYTTTWTVKPTTTTTTTLEPFCQIYPGFHRCPTYVQVVWWGGSSSVVVVQQSAPSRAIRLHSSPFWQVRDFSAHGSWCLCGGRAELNTRIGNVYFRYHSKVAAESLSACARQRTDAAVYFAYSDGKRKCETYTAADCDGQSLTDESKDQWVIYGPCDKVYTGTTTAQPTTTPCSGPFCGDSSAPRTTTNLGKATCAAYFGADAEDNSQLVTIVDVDASTGYPTGHNTFMHRTGPFSTCFVPAPPSGCHRYFKVSE
jgi:hypothetical protein